MGTVKERVLSVWFTVLVLRSTPDAKRQQNVLRRAPEMKSENLGCSPSCSSLRLSPVRRCDGYGKEPMSWCLPSVRGSRRNIWSIPPAPLYTQHRLEAPSELLTLSRREGLLLGVHRNTAKSLPSAAPSCMAEVWTVATQCVCPPLDGTFSQVGANHLLLSQPPCPRQAQEMFRKCGVKQWKTWERQAEANVV